MSCPHQRYARDATIACNGDYLPSCQQIDTKKKECNARMQTNEFNAAAWVLLLPWDEEEKA